MGSVDEKQKQQNSLSNIMFRKNICVGVVTLVKAGDYHEITKNIKQPYEVLDGSYDKRAVIGIDLRKIVFKKHQDCYGEDLFYRLNKQEPYRYHIMDEERKDALENNTIIIRAADSLNELLAYAGFSEALSNHDLKEVKSLLLSEDKVINIREHAARLTTTGIIAPSRVDSINEEASILLGYKQMKIPTKPVKLEKVLGKYFK